jgi:putative ABC transport system permease protein
MALAAVDLMIGIVSALLLSRIMSSIVYGVATIDPLTVVGVSLLLISVALVACYVPARRAVRIDPAVALRHE